MNKVLEFYINRHFAQSTKPIENRLLSLFYIFSEQEIKSIDDFMTAPADFYNLLIENIDLIQKYCNLTKDELIKIFAKIRRNLEYQISSPHHHKEQKEFTDIVSHLAPNKKDCHILDVGPGSMAYSSVLLGQTTPHVTCMDNRYSISPKSLKRMNVNAVKHYLTTQTPISDYDLIVGKAPCSAIDTIVYLCTKYNKPYLIETCDCEWPSPREFNKKWNLSTPLPKPQQELWLENEAKPQTPAEKIAWANSLFVEAQQSSKSHLSKDNWFGWGRLLPQLDSNINFYRYYAYNVGEKPETVENLINE